ncbi:hypothetical protein [Enterococcus sp. AZ196]
MSVKQLKSSSWLAGSDRRDYNFVETVPDDFIDAPLRKVTVLFQRDKD